jgi:hypothetical protein
VITRIPKPTARCGPRQSRNLAVAQQSGDGHVRLCMCGRKLVRRRSLRFALPRLLALIVISVGLAAPSARAGWVAPQLVGHSKIIFMLRNSPFVPSETRPVVAFNRSGGAGLAFVDGASTFLAERRVGGRFSSPVLLASGSGGVVNPLGLAFTKNGAAVGLLHVFDDVGGPATSMGLSGSECCDQLAGLVRPVHRSPAAQLLDSPYRADSHSISGAGLVPAADGLLAFTGGSYGPEGVWELHNGANQFVRRSDLSTSAVGRSVVSLAGDGAGGVFATWETSVETSVSVTGPVTIDVAYRPRGRSFGRPLEMSLGSAGSVLGPDFVSSPLVAGWGRARADFAWVLETPTNQSDPGSARVWVQRLQVAFRGRAGLAHPRTLAVVRHAPVVEGLTADAILVDRSGAPTIAWTDCRPITCSVEVAVSQRAGTVGKAQLLDRDASFWNGLSVAGDARGDEVAAWWSSRGLKAAIRRADEANFGRPRLLSRQVAPIDGGLSTPTPYAAFGPRGEAIVAWITDAGNLEAEAYESPR